MHSILNFWHWYIGLFSADNKIIIAAWTGTLTTITFFASIISKVSTGSFFNLNKLEEIFHSGYTRKQKKIMRYKSKTIPNLNILFRWQVTFDDFTDEPSIIDLTPFCIRHGSEAPRRMQPYQHSNWSTFFKCYADGCTTIITSEYVQNMKNQIESELIHMANP